MHGDAVQNNSAANRNTNTTALWIIIDFPSYKEVYKQREMWHSARVAEISEEICMFQPGHCQATGT
jgi:hypothetical protein